MESEPTTPSRMATRGVRVNYAELSASGGNSRSQEDDDAVFRSPSASTRGKRRRPGGDEDFGSVSRRGRPRGGGGGRGRGGARRSLGGDMDAKGGLFGAVKTGGRQLETAVDEWVTSYEETPEVSLLALLQFFVYACGCRGQLSCTPGTLQNADFPTIIRQLTESFDEESCDYPIIMAGPQYKKFRQNFSDAIHLLISKCKANFLHDSMMMDRLCQLLVGLADSQVRAFRHTATFAAMKLSSALVDVSIEQAEQKEKTRKLFEAEKAKLKQQKTTSEKIDEISRMRTELDERQDEVQQMLTFLFKSVFVHRYRDVVPDTRALCISELGTWMLVYPQHFLEDSYLKYVGWSLHDKVPEVRLKCVAALLPLYTKGDDVTSKLELFTNKFKERLVSMVMDKDTEVAIKSCQLMTNIYRVFPKILTVKECTPIYEQVYANNRSLAVAAGEFLNCKVFQQEEAKTVESKAKLILDIARFFDEGEVHDHAAYLVDALIDTNRMVKEWEVMVGLLLADDQVPLDLEGRLIEVMVCAAKQAATGDYPVGRLVVKRGAPAVVKEHRILKEERKRISLVFIPTIAALLQKFMADRDKVARLMTLPTYFLLDVYTSAHGDKHLTNLLEVIKQVTEKYADEEIMTTTAELMDSLVIQLRDAIGAFDASTSSTQRGRGAVIDDEDNEAALLSAFKKVSAILSHLEFRQPELWDAVLSVVVAVGDGKTTGKEVLDLALNVLTLLLQYELARVCREESTKADAIKKLKKKRDQFIQAAQNILQNQAGGVETAFLCLCDVFIVFSAFPEQEHLKQLVVSLNPQLAQKMREFVDDNVFSVSEDKSSLEQTEEIELMHRKRSLLAQMCKLAMHGVVPYSEVAYLLRHYIKFYSDFGDILKLLILKTRDTDRMASARCLVEALQLAFIELRDANPRYLDPESESFSVLREMAKRFASSLGNDYKKTRDSLALIHRDGILFALKEEETPTPKKKKGAAPPNFAFLEVIVEFSHKLVKQDKLALYNYLQKKMAEQGIVPTDEPAWQPYLIISAAMTQQDRQDDAASVVSGMSNMTVRGRGRGRPRGSGARLSVVPEI